MKKLLALCSFLLAFCLLPCAVMAYEPDPAEMCICDNSSGMTISDREEPDCGSNQDGFELYRCDDCGKIAYYAVLPATHSYDERHFHRLDTPATPGHDGAIQYPCEFCGAGNYYDIVFAPEKLVLSKSVYTYDGKTHKPTIKVYNRKNQLINPSYYKVSYSSGCKKLGSYTVTIRFQQPIDFDDLHYEYPYAGTMKATFRIAPAATKISKISSQKKAFKVYWKKVSKNNSGYIVRYSLYSNMKSAKTKSIGSYKTTSTKVSGLKAKKYYYVQVCSYKKVGSKKIASAWSAVKKVKTK